MRERVVAKVARDVADVELAGKGRAGRWVDDGREPGLVECRVGDAEAGAVGDKTGLASGGREGEAMEGEDSLRIRSRVNAEHVDAMRRLTGTAMGGREGGSGGRRYVTRSVEVGMILAGGIDMDSTLVPKTERYQRRWILLVKRSMRRMRKPPSLIQ